MFKNNSLIHTLLTLLLLLIALPWFKCWALRNSFEGPPSLAVGLFLPSLFVFRHLAGTLSYDLGKGISFWKFRIGNWSVSWPLLFAVYYQMICGTMCAWKSPNWHWTLLCYFSQLYCLPDHLVVHYVEIIYSNWYKYFGETALLTVVCSCQSK